MAGERIKSGHINFCSTDHSVAAMNRSWCMWICLVNVKEKALTSSLTDSLSDNREQAFETHTWK